MADHMQEVRELVSSSQNKKLDLDPREVITLNASIREHMRQLQEDVSQLDNVHKKELKKTRVRVLYLWSVFSLSSRSCAKK